MWSKIRAWLRRGAATAETSAVFGLLSGAPAELETTEFFRWFNLKRVQERRDDEAVTYTPAAESFRHKITLRIFRAPAGPTRSIVLQVDRSLLGEREFEASARDLIKSFVLAVAGPDAPRLSSLANEIQFGELQLPIITRKEVNVPAQPSAVLNILLDREQSALSFDLQHVTIWFDNVMEGERRRLVVCAYPKGTTGLAGWTPASRTFSLSSL